MIRYFITDLDGTLFLGYKKNLFDLTERNKHAIVYASRRGIQFCFASGRMIDYGVRLSKNLEIDHVLCCGFNGAVCYDRSQIVYKHAIETSIVYLLMNFLSKYNDIELIQFQTLDSERIFSSTLHSSYAKYINEIEELGFGHISPFTINQISIEMFSIGKISITCNVNVDCLYHDLCEEFKSLCFVTKSGNSLLEISSRYSSKGVFLRYLVDKYSLNYDEIAVIGDGENDLDMFHDQVTRFAMCNGCSLLKSKANYVVNDVAQAIEKVIDLNNKELNNVNK